MEQDFLPASIYYEHSIRPHVIWKYMELVACLKASHKDIVDNVEQRRNHAEADSGFIP